MQISLPREALRIAAAVVTLLVVQRDQARARQEADARQDVVTQRRVPPHLRPFGVVERPLLEQHGVADPDVADVVQRRAALDVVQLAPADAELLRQPARVPADAARMRRRLRPARMQRVDQRVEQVRRSFLEHGLQALGQALEIFDPYG